jgi:SAM-dependent methyltransferase
MRQENHLSMPTQSSAEPDWMIMRNANLNELLSKYGKGIYDINTIAEEIIAYTGQPELEVWRRLALELDQTGSNVVKETARFGVTPHVFDENLIKFYQESDGFIYETCIEGRNPYRITKWLNIVDFVNQRSKQPDKCNVLLYGDSVGNDSIFLSRMGFNVYYHDFDGYCSRFAKERFLKRSLSVHSFQPGESRQFDFVICFEVAEHVPNPSELIAELAQLTGETGYCIFSESFGLIQPGFPTHLASNEQYIGKADSMFRRQGMHAAWRDVDEKPIVYTRLPDVAEDRTLRIMRRMKEIARSVKHLMHL